MNYVTKFMTKIPEVPRYYDLHVYSLLNYGNNLSCLILPNQKELDIEFKPDDLTATHIFMFNAINAKPLEYSPTIYFCVLPNGHLLGVISNQKWYDKNYISFLNIMLGGPVYFVVSSVEQMDKYFYTVHNYGIIRGQKDGFQLGIYHPDYKQNYFIKSTLKNKKSAYIKLLLSSWHLSDLLNFWNRGSFEEKTGSQRTFKEANIENDKGRIYVTKFVNKNLAEASISRKYTNGYFPFSWKIYPPTFDDYYQRLLLSYANDGQTKLSIHVYSDTAHIITVNSKLDFRSMPVVPVDKSNKNNDIMLIASYHFEKIFEECLTFHSDPSLDGFSFSEIARFVEAKNDDTSLTWLKESDALSWLKERTENIFIIKYIEKLSSFQDQYIEIEIPFSNEILNNDLQCMFYDTIDFNNDEFNYDEDDKGWFMDEDTLL